MERHHKLAKGSPLNLVSLMDIFTILVFFLLVNSSNTQQLPSNKALTLPTSSAKKAPQETLVIMVTKRDILVQGQKVASISTLIDNGEDDIPSLKKELEFLSGGIEPVEGATAKRITIMGDENIPYEVVRKILKSCQQAKYTNIAFAATQVAKKAE
ncbi:MAG: biopolymer transporter ExbD [Agarilytica sp.]